MSVAKILVFDKVVKFMKRMNYLSLAYMRGSLLLEILLLNEDKMRFIVC